MLKKTLIKLKELKRRRGNFDSAKALEKRPKIPNVKRLKGSIKSPLNQ
jgi:hypothetical protein